MPPFDPLHPDLIRQLHRGAQSPKGGHVGAADALETLCAQFRFIPARSDDGVPQPVDHLVADVEKPATLRRLQPFVRARGVHVAAQLVHIELHHADGMRAVDRRENPLRTR